MWSVIVPTLWRGVELSRMLPLLDALECIDEILVIDNAPGTMPSVFKREWRKVRFITWGINLYVNPSWNVGVATAKNNLVCLLSDDVLFDVRVFEWLVPKFNDKMGPVGLRSTVAQPRPPQTIHIDPLPPAPDNYVLEPQRDPPPPYGFGICMWLDKRQFLPIPNDYLIYYGDEWIYYTYGYRGFVPHTINANAITRDNSTSGYNSRAVGEHEKWLTEKTGMGKIRSHMISALRNPQSQIDIESIVNSVKTLSPVFEAWFRVQP